MYLKSITVFLSKLIQNNLGSIHSVSIMVPWVGLTINFIVWKETIKFIYMKMNFSIRKVMTRFSSMILTLDYVIRTNIDPSLGIDWLMTFILPKKGLKCPNIAAL